MSEQFEIKLSWLKNGRDSEVDLSFCRLQIIVGGKNVTQYTAEHTAGDDHLEIPPIFSRSGSLKIGGHSYGNHVRTKIPRTILISWHDIRS
jgi:hypothetical protein